MDLLNLKEDQYIKIKKVKYRVLNKVKFVEKSSYWIEYKLQNIEDNEMYYLNAELFKEAILYKILKENNILLQMNITFEGENYELYEKGVGKVDTYYGMTDVELNAQVSYYEYKSNKDDSKFLSIEKWKDETEISIGKVIKSNDIKILNEFEM